MSVPPYSSFITVTKFGTPAILGEGDVIIGSYYEIASHVIMCLNVELELALVAQKKWLR